MRTISSRGKSPHSTTDATGDDDDIEPYETYEVERSRELGAQRLALTNELRLLYKTCENIALWNLGVVGHFTSYVIVVGFRYDCTQARSLDDFRYAYDGVNPKMLLSSYASSHSEVALHELHCGLPTGAQMLLEPLIYEMQNIQRELSALDALECALHAYAPGGTAHRQLVRKAAQYGDDAQPQVGALG